MKLCFKYSLMVLFAFCLNWLMAQTIDIYYTDTCMVNAGSRFEFSQEKDNHHQAIENIASSCSRMSCEKADTTSSDVPVAKYIQRFIGIYKEFCSISAKKPTPHSLTTYLSVPNTYYVFGLRKIIV